MNQFRLMLMLSKNFMLMIITVLRLNFQQKITVKTAANGRKDVEIAVSLRYLMNFWRTLAFN